MNRIFASLLFVLLASTSAFGAVWQSNNTWDKSWEEKYSAWVKTSWDKDFFANQTLKDGTANPYYGIKVDCADAVYTMRAVFAFENKLPFAFQDPSGGKKLISNKMGRYDWGSKAEIQKFRTFVEDLHNWVSTGSLPNDTMPIAINRETVRAGTLMATTHKNHHSWTVKDILPFGVPWLVFSSRVNAASSLVIMERKTWPNPDWVFEDDFTVAGGAGFRAFRRIEDIGKPVWEAEGYSDEQFKIPLHSWNAEAQNRLALIKETDTQTLTRLLESPCIAVEQRIAPIKEAKDFLAQNSSCMNDLDYDNFSTPSRDRRIFDDLAILRQTYRKIIEKDGGKSLDPHFQRQLDKIFPSIKETATIETQRSGSRPTDGDSVCPVSYAPGKSIDLAEFKHRMFAGRISNNPMDPLEYRWGEFNGHSPEALRCVKGDQWLPDLTTAD